MCLCYMSLYHLQAHFASVRQWGRLTWRMVLRPRSGTCWRPIHVLWYSSGYACIYFSIIFIICFLFVFVQVIVHKTIYKYTNYACTDCEWKAQEGNVCVASFDWHCSGICDSVERMKEIHTSCGEGTTALWSLNHHDLWLLKHYMH